MLSLKNCKWGFLSCYICLQKPLQFGNNNNNNNVTILWERNKKKTHSKSLQMRELPKRRFLNTHLLSRFSCFHKCRNHRAVIVGAVQSCFYSYHLWRRRRRKKAKTKNAVIFSNIGHVSCGNLYSWAFQINSSVFHLSKKSQGSGGSLSKRCKYPRIIWCSLHKMLGTCHKAMVRMLNKNVAFSYNVKNVYLLSSSPKKNQKIWRSWLIKMWTT